MARIDEPPPAGRCPIGMRRAAVLLAVLLAAGCHRKSHGGSGAAAAPPPPPPGPVVDLDADSDRDGAVEASDEDDLGEEAWSPSRGAVFYHNIDDDDRTAVEDASDGAVNGAADAEDLARLLVRSYPVPGGGSVTVTVAPAAAQGAVRIFRNGGGSWSSVYSSGASFALPAADVAAGEIELGIEARSRVSASWDGTVTLALEIRDGAGALLGTDPVQLRSAPWIMASNLWTAEELQVVNLGAENQPLRSVLSSAAGQAGAAYVEAPGASYSYDRWIQDSHEPGVVLLPKSGVPRRRVDSVLQCARSRPIDQWCKDALFGPDYDFIARFGTTTTSMNYGGNLELLPPHTSPSGTVYPWGRILVGGGTSPPIGGTTPVTRRMDAAYLAFWNALGVQGPYLEVSSEWLYVGHVDEHTQVVPAPATARGWCLLFASPALARTLLEQVQAGGGGSRQVFAGRTGWQTTVNSILADAPLLAFNAEVQQRLDAIRAVYRSQVGLSDAEIVDLPVLFEDAGQGRAAAYNPAVVNLVTLPAANGAIHLVVPDPEGPDFPTDIWADETARRLRALGTASRPVTVSFADVFLSYHVNLGEAHCGINTRRTPPADDWWNK